MIIYKHSYAWVRTEQETATLINALTLLRLNQSQNSHHESSFKKMSFTSSIRAATFLLNLTLDSGATLVANQCYSGWDKTVHLMSVRSKRQGDQRGGGMSFLWIFGNPYNPGRTKVWGICLLATSSRTSDF
jgi:hypothetical protein